MKNFYKCDQYNYLKNEKFNNWTIKQNNKFNDWVYKNITSNESESVKSYNDYIKLDVYYTQSIRYYHYYNDIPYTKWPFYICNSLFLVIFYGVMFLNKWVVAGPLAIISFLTMLYFIYLWFSDLVIESVWFGKYNRKLRAVIVAGFILFLISEVFLFGGFFWAYFDRFFHLPVSTGSSSIPLGVEVFVWFKKPLYGTIILLFSTVAFNRANYCMKWGSWIFSVIFSMFGILLGLLFLLIQATEYLHLNFNISDSVYCSCFYLLTGFHGFHVVIGLVFLSIQHLRLENFQFTRERHLGYLLAMMYWHFVDIVWIFLFLFVYAFNNAGFPKFITV